MIQHSYDIFDTCLTRLCGDPKLIFVQMAREIFGNSVTDTQANDFRYMRVCAEICASRDYKERTSLIDIYNQLDFYAFTGLNNEQLIDLECRVEERNLRPIKKSLDEIDNIHKSGNKIIFISDMYLSSAFLIKVLKKYGYWSDSDSLYVSCECGFTKSSGELYDYVKRKEQLQRVNWIHHGDNIKSDIKIPGKKGIKVKSASTNYTSIQQLYQTLGCKTTSYAAQMMSGVMRSLNLEYGNDTSNKFAIDLIAPIYVPFVYNVLKDASNRKIKKLFFLSRDGYIFYKIADVFKSCFPDVDARFLYVSRKSLYLPSIEVVDRASLESLIVNTNYSSIKEHIDNLQLDFDDEFYKQVESGMSPVDVILQNPVYFKMVEEKIKEQREIIIKYFEQEGLASQLHNTAIVDLRGTRRCQKCISDILVSAGYSEVFGYYLEVVHDRIFPKSQSDYCAYMFGDNIAENRLFRGLQSSKDIFEHYFSITSLQRTSGYKEMNNIVIPLFDKDDIDSNHNRHIMDINITMCKRIAESILTLNIEKESDEILNLGFAGLASFMRSPKEDYIAALVGVKASQTAHNTRSLISKITPLSLLHHDIAWYEGSIVYTFGKLGLYFYKKNYPLLKRVYKWIQ